MRIKLKRGNCSGENFGEPKKSFCRPTKPSIAGIFKCSTYQKIIIFKLALMEENF